jgi:hypothetical protein
MANMAVVVDGICLFTRVTGAGLEGMGIELAERRSLTLEQARMWLRRVGFEDGVDTIEGDAETVRDARAILAEGTRRLATEVRASLEFHQTQAASGAGIARAVLTGAAASVPGFADALSAELAMPVETRSVGASDELAATTDLGGVTIAAGLAVEAVPALEPSTSCRAPRGPQRAPPRGARASVSTSCSSASWRSWRALPCGRSPASRSASASPRWRGSEPRRRQPRTAPMRPRPT